MKCIQTLGRHNWRVAHLFYSLTYLRFGVAELDFWCSGVGKILVLGVSVPRCDVCQYLEDILEVALISFYSQTCLRLAVSRARFWVFWCGKRTCSWNISTKALPEWYKPLLCIPCDVCKHLEDIIEVVIILFYSQTYLCLAVFRARFWVFWGS